MVFVIVRDKKQNISNARKTLRKFTKLSVKPEIDGRCSEYKEFAVEISKSYDGCVKLRSFRKLIVFKILLLLVKDVTGTCIIANGIEFGEKGLKFFVKQGFGIGTGGDSKHGDFLVCERETDGKKTLDQTPTKVYPPFQLTDAAAPLVFCCFSVRMFTLVIVCEIRTPFCLYVNNYY
jgi:hypothetical protein